MKEWELFDSYGDVFFTVEHRDGDTGQGIVDWYNDWLREDGEPWCAEVALA